MQRREQTMPRHPDLNRKLLLLYFSGLNTRIDKHNKLARELGIARQNISKWINGSDTHEKDSVPTPQVAPIARLFSIEPAWLRLPFDEFERRVQRRLEGLNLVEQLRVPLVFTNVPCESPFNFVGRDEALGALGYAWANARVSCVNLHGFGGIGKSALVDAWLAGMMNRSYCGADLVFLWSFSRSQELNVAINEAQFLDAAMTWLGLSKNPYASATQKATAIIGEIGSKRTLIVIDGLDLLQRVERGRGILDAAGIQHLINERTRDGAGLLVTSSRLPAKYLSNRRAGGVLDLSLSGMGLAEAMEFFENEGISTDPIIAEELAEQFGGHPLALKFVSELSASRIERGLDGGLDAGFIGRSLFGHTPRTNKLIKLVSDIHLIAQQSVAWCLQDSAKKVLNTLALIGHGLTLLELIVLLEKYYALRPKTTQRVVRELTEAHLVTISVLDKMASHASKSKAPIPETEPLLRLQPLVADACNVALEQFEPSECKGRRSDLFDGLVALAEVPGITIEDRTRLFLLAVKQGVKAERFEEAYDIYFQRLKQDSAVLGAESKRAERRTLAVFFERHWDTPLRQFSALARTRLNASAATNLMALGLTAAASAPAFASVRWFISQGYNKDAFQIAGPLMSMLIATGKLGVAQDLMNELAPLDDIETDRALRSAAFSFSGLVAFLQGQKELALQAFEESEAILQTEKIGAPLFPTVSSHYCVFLLEMNQTQQALARSLQTLAWREAGDWQTKVDGPTLEANDLMVLGFAYFRLGFIPEAEELFEKQLSILVAAEEWLYLPAGLVARAQFYAAIGSHAAAKADLNEALRIAERTGAILSRIDALLCFTQLHITEGSLDYARAYLAEARLLSDQIHLAYYADKIQSAENEIDAPSVAAI